MSVTPELALAAAAAIRDTALEQQTQELLQLREQLRASHEVTITGPMGTPVYCRGSFQEGNFRQNVGLEPPGVLWEVALSPTEDFEDGLPLRKFSAYDAMEIRLGGVVYATTVEAEGKRCRVRGAASSSSREDVFCPLYSGNDRNKYNRIAWMAINFRQLPAGPWKMLQSCAKYNAQSSVGWDDKEDIFYSMTQALELPARLPDQKAYVTSTCFHASSVLALIRDIERDEDFEAQKRKEFSVIGDMMQAVRDDILHR